MARGEAGPGGARRQEPCRVTLRLPPRVRSYCSLSRRDRGRRERRERCLASPRARVGTVALGRAVTSIGAVVVLGAVAVVGIVAMGTPAASTQAAGAGAVRAGIPGPVLEAPLAPFRAARLFDRPVAPWAAGHRGIDLAAAPGDEVRSPGRGVVTFAGTVVDRGVVTVDHGGGLLSSIEPIAASVAVGDAVGAGAPLGVVTGERGHCAPWTCVHWGVRLRGVYVNPLDILAGYGRIVLLP